MVDRISFTAIRGAEGARLCLVPEGEAAGVSYRLLLCGAALVDLDGAGRPRWFVAGSAFVPGRIDDEGRAVLDPGDFPAGAQVLVLVPDPPRG